MLAVGPVEAKRTVFFIGYFSPLADGTNVPRMAEETAVSMLGNLGPEPKPSFQQNVLKKLDYQANLLEDIKLKQSITNELLLELVELGKGMARSDFGAPVRPIRNKPFPHPIRHRYGSKP